MFEMLYSNYIIYNIQSMFSNFHIPFFTDAFKFDISVFPWIVNANFF